MSKEKPFFKWLSLGESLKVSFQWLVIWINIPIICSGVFYGISTWVKMHGEHDVVVNSSGPAAFAATIVYTAGTALILSVVADGKGPKRRDR